MLLWENGGQGVNWVKAVEGIGGGKERGGERVGRQTVNVQALTLLLWWGPGSTPEGPVCKGDNS